MNDETLFDPKEVKDEPQNNEVMNNDETVAEEMQQPLENEMPKEKKKKDFKMAGIAGAAGVAGAAIGVLTPVNLFPDAPEIEEGGDAINENEAHPAPSSSAHLQGHDMEVATSVNDSMNFSQAFAAARHEAGPGGLFVWHGHTYGTYYANEWNAMTPEEQNQYWADVHHTTSHIVYEPQPEPEPTPDPIPDPAPNPQPEPEPDPQPDPEPQPEPEPHPDPNPHPDDPTPAPQPETLQIHEDDVIAVMDVDDDGKIDLAFVDANHNNKPDLVADTTGDGKFDTLVLDPEMDEEGELVVNEANVHEIDDVHIITNEVVDPVVPVNGNVLELNENEVFDSIDVNDDGQIDALIVDANGNAEADLVLDTTGDGKMDTLILDPGVDDEGNLVINEDNVSNIGGVVITSEQDPDNQPEYIAENQDVDELANVTPDPDITIDNNMGMDDFIG